MRTRPGAPIVKIHLAAEPARPRSAQGGLFLPPSPEPEKLELTLARIAGMVGEHKVGALELLDTHHPDGFRMQRFVAAAPAKKSARRKLQTRQKKRSLVTALRRFRPALCAQRNSGKWPARARELCEEERSTGRLSSGRPAPGASPATGGNEKPGPATNGTSPCATAKCRLILPPRARSARRRLVRGRNV